MKVTCHDGTITVTMTRSEARELGVSAFFHASWIGNPLASETGRRLRAMGALLIGASGALRDRRWDTTDDKPAVRRGKVER